ncbi:MAG: hypothetical protein HY717_06375 [Planctomycetes bacterium]|nr:hypothetical protein [Planctomycetota bacterium]
MIVRFFKLLVALLFLAALELLCPKTALAQAAKEKNPPAENPASPAQAPGKSAPAEKKAPVELTAPAEEAKDPGPATESENKDEKVPESLEAPEAPAEGAVEVENKPGILNRVFNMFRGKNKSGEEEAPEEEGDTADKNFRKIKELERFAVRNYQRKRLSEAKKNLNDLITLKPYDAAYHFALGLCFRKEERYDDALKKYQDVLDLGGPKPIVHLLMSEAMAVKGDKAKIFEHIKDAAVSGRNIIHDVQSLQLLDQYKTDTEFIKLALSLEKYEIGSKRTQDPMTNPFPLNTPGGGIFQQEQQAPGEGQNTLSPEEQQKMLNEARKLYDRVLWYIKLEDEDKAMDSFIQLQKVIEKKELVTIPKLASDFQLLVNRMESLEVQIEGIRLKFYYTQALAQLKRMKDAFYETEYGKVESIYQEVQKLAKEMERTNKRYQTVADQILKAATVWVEKTRIRKEFETNKPKIQGIIISDATKKAIINNQIINQGEQVGEFMVQKVENNRITFRYKGEEIPLVFRRY